MFKMPVSLDEEGEDLKKVVNKICEYLFEIFIWFICLWMIVISITCAYLFPREGIVFIISATLLTLIPKIYNKIKKY